VYREAIARAVGGMRPALEVRSASLAELGPELRRFDPHVVVCSRTGDGYPGGRGAWVQVPTVDGADDDGRPARICLEGARWDTDGPTLGEILGSWTRRGAPPAGRTALARKRRRGLLRAAFLMYGRAAVPGGT
jgi:hypothetical protein